MNVRTELYLLRGSIADIIEYLSNVCFLWGDTFLIQINIRSWLIGPEFDQDEIRFHIGPVMFTYIIKKWSGSNPDPRQTD